ncbi:MAG: DcrB-related protein [Candidatus Sedimenticola sp. (ex Thyasira tokunagai)]
MPMFQGSGFVIDVPEECVDASVYTFAFPEKGGYAANLMVRFEAVVGAFDLQKYVKEQLDGLQQKVEEFKLVSQAAGKRGTSDGVMSVYEWGKEPARIRQKQVVLFVPGEQPRKYILTATDLASQSANSDPLFDQMLRSFEINVA